MKKLLNLKKDHFLLTELPSYNPQAAHSRGTAVLSALEAIRRDYKDRRQAKTERMLESWGLYLNSEEANQWLRRQAIQTTGNFENDWQHRVQDGLCFRTVETIVAYIMGAFFPNEDWFDLTPQAAIDDEEYLLYLKVMKTYIRTKMKASSVKEKTEGFVRQAAITGISAMALPWRFETKTTKRNVRVRDSNTEDIQIVNEVRTIYNEPELQVLDAFDFWLDPDEPDPNLANFMRRLTLTRGELARLVKSKHYDLCDMEDLKNVKTTPLATDTNYKTEVDMFGGISQSMNNQERVEVYEFWGTLTVDDVEYQDVVATWVDNTLLRFETNPYWSGRPFVFATYTPLMNSPYGIGALEPIRGLVHEKNSIKNQRLDAGSLSLNPMYEFINDGTFDADTFYTAPGKMIPVSALGATMRPITFDRGYHSISVNEEQSLGQDIELTTGTGAFVGQSPGRSGERVTAQEIQASRDAGGNRLSSTHAHLEEQFLTRLLTKYYLLCQQFQIEDEVIPVMGDSNEELLYVKVGIEQLGVDFYFTPTGATHIADKEYDLRNMLDWVTAVNGVPEMAQNIDWNEVVKELTKRFLGGNIERFMKKQEDPEAPSPSSVLPNGDPNMGAVEGDIANIGGAEMVNMLASQEQAAPGITEASLAATGPSAVLPPGIDPEMLQASLQAPML